MLRLSRLVVFVCAAALVGCAEARRPDAGAGDGSALMDLEVELSCGQTDLIVGEDAPLAIKLTNRGAAPLTIPDPLQNETWPQMRVLKAGGTRRSFAPGEIVNKGANEFMPPRPALTQTLAPGQSTAVDATILTRVEFSGEGKYDLSAAMEFPGGVAESKPVSVTLHKLELRSAAVVGAHNGHSPYRWCVWSHADGAASILGLTQFMFDQHGEGRRVQSLRLGRFDGAVQPLISGSPNKLPYPNHWIAWLDAGRLSALYTRQGRLDVPVKSHPLPDAGAMIPPVLNDLEGNDGSTPGRGEIAFWSKAGGLSVRVLEPGGTLGTGAGVAADAGELKWGRSALLSDSARYAVLIVSRGGGCDLEYARWNAKGAASPRVAPVARWKDDVLAAGMTVGADDTMYGGALSRSPATAGGGTSQPASAKSGLTLHAWRIAANGQATEQPPVSVDLPPGQQPQSALLEVSAAGNLIALIRSSAGRWFMANARGQCAPLPDEPLRHGEPIGAFWLNDVEPMLLLASPNEGIQYHGLHAHGH